MLLNNIPLSMREYRQWVGFLNTPNAGKVPYNMLTGKPASVINANDWTDFDTAVKLYQPHYNGIGFVLTKNDPFTIIDLDQSDDPEVVSQQQEIASKFDTYSERSISKKGLHIIAVGSIPQGRRSTSLKVEMYSDNRYMIMTGDVFDDKPIAHQQSAISELYERLGSDRVIVTDVNKVSEPAIHSDQEVINMAWNANGDAAIKFRRAWNGEIQFYENDNSAAEQVLANYLVFYSRNFDQARRLFLQAPQTQRPKCQDPRVHPTYVDGTITKGFDRIARQIQINDSFFNGEIVNDTVAPQPVESELAKETDCKITRPPGLLGDIADYIYDQANRAVPEIAYAGAIGILSGFVGRFYNVDGLGLNHYMMLIAKTGRGKDAIETGANKIVKGLKDERGIQWVDEFLGPSDFASGPAVNTSLKISMSKCFVSIADEFASTLLRISDQNAYSSDRTFLDMLIKLYSRCGDGQIYRPKQYSEAGKGGEDILSPGISIMGNGQPKVYYRSITESHVYRGLIPRFITVHYSGLRLSENEGHETKRPPARLLDQFSTILTVVHNYLSGQSPVKPVEWSSEARQLRNEYNLKYDKLINDNEGDDSTDVIANLYTRADMKVKKLAALVAVGINPHNPLITPDCVEWAANLIELDITTIIEKLGAGETGHDVDEFGHATAMRECLTTWFTTPVDQLRSKKWCKIGDRETQTKLYKSAACNKAYFLNKWSRKAAFKKQGYKGPMDIMNAALRLMISNGELIELPPDQANEKFGTYATVLQLSAEFANQINDKKQQRAAQQE